MGRETDDGRPGLSFKANESDSFPVQTSGPSRANIGTIPCKHRDHPVQTSGPSRANIGTIPCKHRDHALKLDFDCFPQLRAQVMEGEIC
jgi:hypothetical protein